MKVWLKCTLVCNTCSAKHEGYIVADAKQEMRVVEVRPKDADAAKAVKKPIGGWYLFCVGCQEV